MQIAQPQHRAPEPSPLLQRGTHKEVKLVRLPSVEGMVPLNWLKVKDLQKRVRQHRSPRAAAANASTHSCVTSLPVQVTL